MLNYIIAGFNKLGYVDKFLTVYAIILVRE